MTADGEQTEQDAERTNTRAKSLEEFIKELVQDAEGIRKSHFNFYFSPTEKFKKGIAHDWNSPYKEVTFLNSILGLKSILAELFGVVISWNL